MKRTSVSILLSMLLCCCAPTFAQDFMPTLIKSPLDTFNWVLEPLAGSAEELGYRYYSFLGDRGTMGGGPSYSVAIADGAAVLRARTVQVDSSWPSSWVGMWFSLNETDRNKSLVLDLQRALPWPIKADFQFRCVQWYARVSGSGSWKLELKDSAGKILGEWKNLEAGYVIKPISASIGEAKLLNIVVESDASLRFDEVGFIVQVPAGLTPLRYAALVSLGQILRCYGTDATGRAFVRDHAQWPLGDFDAVPGLGMVALAVAAVADLGFIDPADARAVASACIASLRGVPRHASGWLPHWLKNGLRHPDSEISTLDTALAYWTAIQAASMLGLDADLDSLQTAVRNLDFEAVSFTDPGNGNVRLSMGFDKDDRLIPYAWSAWGGETQLLRLLGALRYEPFVFEHDHVPPVYGGRGFIMELAGLEFAEFGGGAGFVDAYGVDWNLERRRHLKKQKAAFAGRMLWGLSSVEVSSRLGSTRYLEGGVGSPGVPRMDGSSDVSWGRPWIAPHYMGMAAALEPGSAARRVREMVRLGLMPPLSGPAESAVYLGRAVRRSHSVRTALNAYFNTIGYYHAVLKAESKPDRIYAVSSKVPAIEAAVQSLLAH